MDKLMDSPWFLRITALLLAMFLFLSAKSGDESLNAANNGTMTDVIRDIPVEVYYDDDNLVVTGVPETVDMTIEGPSSLVQTAKQLKDFTVFVDLRNLNMGEHEVLVQVENLYEKLDSNLDPAYIDVSIEEKVTKELRVDPEFNDRLLAENFVVSSMKSNPERIQITGAKSVVESISYVKATVVGDHGLNETFTQKASVKVLDKDLSKLNVIIEPTEVEVTVEIEEYSREIPISLQQTGTIKDGVVINELTPKTKTVRAFGNKAVIDNIDTLIVDVDVSALETPGTLKVKIPVPKGVTRISKEEIEVEADVTPAPADEKIIEEDTAQIESRNFEDVNIVVRGLNESDSYSFLEPENGELLVTVRGNNTYLDSLEEKDFQLYVDASDAPTGENQLDVQVEGLE
ncbi:MAG: CdaR family protein, partial [Paenisporosarcina sp.]